MSAFTNVANTPAGSYGGIQWVVINKAYLRRLRLISLAAIAAMVVLAAVESATVVLGAPSRLPVHKLFLPVSVLAIAVVAQFLVLAGLRRLSRRRLGVATSELLFDPGNDNVERYRFDEVITGDLSQLLLGKRLIPLYGPLGPLFEEDNLQKYVLARLAPSSKIGTPRLFREALRRGSRDLWIVLVAVFLVGILLLLVLVQT